MRKFITFIGAALLSITAMNATVVTKTVDWILEVNEEPNNTFTVNAWSAASKWSWMTGADEYEQLVIEVANHDYDILVTAQFTVDGSSQVASAGIMRAGTNSVAVDVTNPVLQAIEVKNWSGNEDVTISVTNMYLRKIIGPKKTVSLWSGSMYFDTFKDWGQEIILDDNAFADAHIGDILEIDYTLDATGYYQMSVQTSYNQYRPTFLGTLDAYNNYIIEKQANPNKFSFAIMDETDLTKLKEDGGLRINGALFTVTAVKLRKHDVLWTGTANVDDNWSGGQSIAWSKLTNLKAGNILCVRVTAGEYVEGKYNQVLCTYNSSWSGTFSPSVNYVFQEGDVMPMIVEIPVTHKMLHQLNGEQLNIGGRNFTMTDIYVLEGTPATNVAAYLDVTSAGMATYVLPFNVPSLPDGVKAYRLTNDGSNEIVATEVSELTEDKPVLIVADEGEYEFLSQNGASDDVSEKTGTYQDGALVGTYVGINPVPASSGSTYNYVLQNGGDGVAFYQVTGTSNSIAPYHAYLSCSYNSLAAEGAPVRIRFVENTATGNEEIVNCQSFSRKLIKDGQLLIIHDGKMYNAVGQLVK